MKLIKYPIGIQTFSEIVTEGYKYVDKSRYVYELATRGKYYFLSRPRRFGKSLLLSTIEAFFKGKKELFKGLYAYDKEWDWVEHPVFHLALNGQNYTSIEKLDETLDYYISEWEKAYGVPVNTNIRTVEIRFANCIRRAAEITGRRVVILIDEYDQPLLQNIEQGKEDLHNAMRVHLQSFFAVMKAQDQYIRFGMLTGVSMYRCPSAFGGLNNLDNISLDINYNGICGITESELAEYFNNEITSVAEANCTSREDVKAKLKRYYGGYHFRGNEVVYNPDSLLNAFIKNDFRNYWTPSRLTRCAIDNLSTDSITNVEMHEDEIHTGDIYDPILMLLLSGGLAIKSFDPEFRVYRIDFPNKEVADYINGMMRSKAIKSA